MAGWLHVGALTVPELLLVLEVVRYLKRHAGVANQRSDASSTAWELWRCGK